MPHLFIATGSGIAPFHSILHSEPSLDYTLLHGVRHLHERYEHEGYDPQRYIACVTRDAGGDFQGRVTDWLAQHDLPPDARYYLCGNSDMIYQAFDILQEQGIPRTHLHTEVYF